MNTFRDPLHAAIAEGDPELRILVDAGANVDAENTYGDPALHRAILKGDRAMVRVLVEAGANVHATNVFGDSALSRAVHQGDRDNPTDFGRCHGWLTSTHARGLEINSIFNLPSSRSKFPQCLEETIPSLS